MRICVETKSGEQVTFGRAFLRMFMLIVFNVVTCGFHWLLALVNKRKQGLHDVTTGITVRKTGESLGFLGIIASVAAIPLVSVGVLLFMMGLFLPFMAQARANARDKAVLENGNAVGEYIRMYVDDHEGRLPASLNELLRDYEMDAKLLVMPHLDTVHAESGESLNEDNCDFGFYARGKTLDDLIPQYPILLSKPYVYGGKEFRFVITADCSCSKIDEEAYRLMCEGLRKLGIESPLLSDNKDLFIPSYEFPPESERPEIGQN